MKKSLISIGAALWLALFLSGCETNGGVTTRAREKSATYAALKPWQKKYVDKGTIAEGFTPDMVYIAMGRPDKVETKDFPEGKAEMWTYSQYYPHVDAVHGFRNANFTTESAYQPQRPLTQSADGSNSPGAKQIPVGMDLGKGQSNFATGGPQGGSMEPADLRSYTIRVLFAGDKVVRIGAEVNP